jgi:hypothetical protein
MKSGAECRAKRAGISPPRHDLHDVQLARKQGVNEAAKSCGWSVEVIPS